MFAALLLTRTLAFTEAQRIVSVAGAITGIVQTVRSVVEALDQSATASGWRRASALNSTRRYGWPVPRRLSLKSCF